jgi:hypothetical protein
VFSRKSSPIHHRVRAQTSKTRILDALDKTYSIVALEMTTTTVPLIAMNMIIPLALANISAKFTTNEFICIDGSLLVLVFKRRPFFHYRTHRSNIFSTLVVICRLVRKKNMCSIFNCWLVERNFVVKASADI